MKTSKNISWICFTILSLVFVLPHIQSYTGFMKERDLNGYAEKRMRIDFNWENWTNESFQLALENHLKDNISLRPTFIRIRNQLDYLLFGKLHAAGVHLGKEGHFFRYTQYFISGGNYPGDSIIEKNVVNLKNTQIKLKEEGKSLVFVIAPDKLWIYQDFLPDPNILNEKSMRFYLKYIHYLKKHSCNYIDLNDAFMTLKNKQEGLLFSKGGYHWTEYGAYRGMDSIYNFLMANSEIPLEKMKGKSFIINQKPWSHDRDMMDACNLQFIPSLDENYTHPQLTKIKNTNSAILSGDSFCHAIWWTHFFDIYFGSQSSFWYYNREIYDKDNNLIGTPETNIGKKLINDSKNYIVLYSAGNLEKFDYGFLNNFKD